MSRTVYLHLLFFCGIVCQGIFAVLDKHTRLSTNCLVRKRRVVNHLPHGRNAVRMAEVNYIVRLREANRTKCAGVILSHYTVITAALCIDHHYISDYQILSGGATSNAFTSHNLTSVALHSGNPPHQNIDGIALLIVDPPFEYSRNTGSIELYRGPLPEGTMVTVFGWGYIYPLTPRLESRHRLRAITLPIINHQECKNAYSNHLNITDKHICTYDAQQHCARNDEGAPLVIHDRLAGIHIVKEAHENQINPDVFINLQRPEYREWILSNTRLM